MAGNQAGSIQLISTTNAAAPGGHYAQAVVHQGVLYVSGQLPIRADGVHSAGQPFEVQAAIALDNPVSYTHLTLPTILRV